MTVFFGAFCPSEVLAQSDTAVYRAFQFEDYQAEVGAISLKAACLQDRPEVQGENCKVQIFSRKEDLSGNNPLKVHGTGSHWSWNAFSTSG